MFVRAYTTDEPNTWDIKILDTFLGVIEQVETPDDPFVFTDSFGYSTQLDAESLEEALVELNLQYAHTTKH